MSEEKKSRWQEYLDNQKGAVKPWDLINPNTEWASEEEANKRYEICKGCPELMKMTKTCKKCGCFMKAKTKLQLAVCPLGKW